MQNIRKQTNIVWADSFWLQNILSEGKHFES